MSDGLCECGCGGATPIATRTDPRFGAVKGQPRRFIHGHFNRKPFRWTEDENGCWVWGGTMHKHNGYGALGGRQAHRQVYELLVRPIPDGLQLDHLCRNRACVRPAHLEPVTNAENARRGKGTKLTPENVLAIRASGLSNATLAKMYGASESHVDNIRAGRKRLDVPFAA